MNLPSILMTFRCLRAILVAWVALPICAARAEPVTLFAFDDDALPYRQNLKTTFTIPEKHQGNPVISPGPPGSVDAVRAQFYGSVIRVEGVFRLWYCAISDGETTGNVSRSARIAYAESDDGVNWVKPELGLTEFNGDPRNNLVGMPPGLDFSRIEPLACFVLHEPEDPDPGRRYKMAVYGRYYPTADAARFPGVPDDNIPSTIYPFFSADGLRWTLAVPTPSGSAFDQTEAPIRVRNNFELGGLYKFDGLYHVAGQELSPDVFAPDGSLVRRTMVTHWSADFVHWSQDKALAFQRWGYRGPRQSFEEAHEPAAIWNRGNVLIGLYGLWHGAVISSERRMDLGFLISNDGIHFREPVADHVFLAAGSDGTWDQRGLIHGQGFENVGDTTFLYYGNWDLSGDRKTCAIGLATVPRDRIAGLSTRDPGEGLMTSRPWICPRPVSLRINAEDLSRDAVLRLELTDRSGRGIPGYSGQTAVSLTESGFGVPVVWADGPMIRCVESDFRIRMAFLGRDAARIKFYAAYLE